MHSIHDHPTAHDNPFSLCDGWSSADIAQIDRIRVALLSVSANFDCGCGVTDEGDPWFAFCWSDGEVIVHLARSKSAYHLFAPAISRPLSGRILPDMVCALLRTMVMRRPHRASG